MSIPYINFSTANHTGVILGAQQSIQRRMNLRPDWNELRCVAMARIIGGNTPDSGTGALGETISHNVVINSVSLPIQKFYFGMKDSSLNYPETPSSKFIGIGVGTEPNLSVQYISDLSGASTYVAPGPANATMGIRYYNPSISGMRYGVSVGNSITSTLKANPPVSSAPNHRFQPAINGGSTAPSSNFCSSVGFIIKVANRGTENQEVSIFNYGSQTSNGNVTSTGFRTFSSLSESVLDQELDIMGNNFHAHNGGLTHTFNVPHSQYDLSNIDSFYIHWPFPTNRLILFNLKIKDYTL